MKIFKKKKKKNGRRHIYFCGIKIFSYTSKKSNIQHIYKKYPQDIALKKIFKIVTGKKPTDKLKKLTDKIIWLQMFGVTRNKELCADKYTVREFVAKEIGDWYLIKLIHVFDSVKEFNITNMPNQFVLKYSEGSGKVFIVNNKNDCDIKYIEQKLQQWEKDKFFLRAMEMQYKNSARKFLVEEKIDTKIEYKLWCFHGKCKFIKIEIMNEYAENGKPENQYGKYFYPDWSPADFRTIGKEPEFEIKKPKKLKELIKISEKLAAPFDFVRVDFYETKTGELKFGELTFSPAAGRIHFVPKSKDIELGKLLSLDK